MIRKKALCPGLAWLKLVFLICTSFFSLVTLVGCTTSSKQVYPPGAADKIEKIAVLPFYNISGEKDAGKIVANIFVAELFKSGRFYVEEPGNIVQFMIQERVDTLGEIEIERLKILGKRLGVDAVIVGMVEEFNDGRGRAYPTPTVSITARMVESESGRLIWSSQNRRKGDDYIIILDIGEIRSATTLAQEVIREMIATIR